MVAVSVPPLFEDRNSIEMILWGTTRIRRILSQILLHDLMSQSFPFAAIESAVTPMRRLPSDDAHRRDPSAFSPCVESVSFNTCHRLSRAELREGVEQT